MMKMLSLLLMDEFIFII